MPNFSLRICGGTAATLVVSSAMLFAQAPQPAAARFPTTGDLRHLKSVSAPQLAPDGKSALVTITDATADGAKSHLWLIPIGVPAAEPRQLTFSPPADKRGERGAVWAADGTAIYFTAKRGEHTQLFRLDLRGGDAQPFDLKVMPPVDDSKAKGALPPPDADKDKPKADDAKPEEKKPEKNEPIALDVAGFALAPSRRWIALWASDPETPGEKKQKEAKADAQWVDHETHRTRLYLAALNAGGIAEGALKPVALAPEVQGAVWSWSGDKLLVFAEEPNNASDLGPAGSAWLVDAAAVVATKLKALPATARAAAFTPEGATLVFAAQTPEDAPPGYDELYAVPVAGAAGDATATRLSAGFAGEVSARGLYFTPEGAVVAEAAIGTRVVPVRIALDGKTPPAPVELGAPVVSGLNTNRARSGWLWLAESGAKPPALCFAAHLGEPCTALPLPALAPAGLNFVEPQLVHWHAPGAAFDVEGLLYLPPTATGANPARVPLVVDVHGGPFGAWENRSDAYAAFLVGHGWAVLRPNPRGSSNYGVVFAAANKNDLGGGDYRDVIAGVDAVLAQYPIDPDRMALIGYSYGGEMAAFVEGKTTRFKAIVSMAPVIDQFSEYGTESGSWYDRWYFGKPWEHMQDAWRQSPLSGVGNAKTPFMLIQGESDTIDPLGQAQEMYRALRQQGVPVELVTYPRENHGPLAMGIFGRPSPEPWHGYDARQRLIEFLSKAFGAAAGGTPNPL